MCRRDRIIKPTLLLFAAMLSAAVTATPAAARGGGGRSQTSRSVTVPLQFDGDYPVIIARINGQKVALTIDLAQSAPIVLRQSTVDSVKAVVVTDSRSGAADAAADADAASSVAPSIKVQHIEIGDITFSNVDGYIDVRPLATQTPTTPQGVIGLALLRSFKVILNYQHKSITFIRGSRFAAESDACTGTKVPFMPEWHGAPVAKARTDIGDLILIFDTGAARGVIRKKSADDLHATVSKQLVSLPHLNFGDADMGAMDFQVVDFAQLPGIDGFVGDDFFAEHVVCVDFPGTAILVRR